VKHVVLLGARLRELANKCGYRTPERSGRAVCEACATRRRTLAFAAAGRAVHFSATPRITDTEQW
jgi:hypothetical protein